MRPIDADKLKPLFSPALTGKTTYTSDEIMLSIVSSATVEAIPIEWIVKWLTKQTIPALHTCDDYEAVNVMLDDWEKENGL